MTTQISGDTGVSQCQPNSVSQDDLQSGVTSKGPLFSAKRSVNQTGYTTGIDILFDVEEHDTNGCFADSAFTPNVPGYYRIDAMAYLRGSAILTVPQMIIKKNGSPFRFGGVAATFTSNFEAIASLSVLIYMNGTTDYVTAGASFSGGGTLYVSSGNTLFQGNLVRAA